MCASLRFDSSRFISSHFYLPKITLRFKHVYTINVSPSCNSSSNYLYDEYNKSRGPSLNIPSRYIVVMLGFLSFFVLNSQRVNLSMAIVAMSNASLVNDNSININNNSASECKEAIHAFNNASKKEEEGHNFTQLYGGMFQRIAYKLTNEMQGYVQSASFMGFILTQIPGGILSEVVGAKKMLIFSIFCASICNVFSPWAAIWSAYLFISVHFVKGLAQGIVQPAVSCLMARWFPKQDIGLLSSLTFCGYPAGAFVGGLASGALCDSDFLGGWPSVFFVFGTLGLIVSILLIFFLFNSPDHDPKISDAEYKYITSSKENNAPIKLKLPWCTMLSSISTWALFIGMFGQYWMTFYFLSIHPNYLGDVLHFKVTQNGILSSVPYILQSIITWMASYISDWATRKNYATTDTVRKLCNTLSCIGFSFSFLGIAFSGCNLAINITCVVVAMGSIGFGYPGSLTVPLDMTPNFAGILMGISTTIASLSGFILPLIVSELVGHQPTLKQWQKVFYVCNGIGLFSGIFFHCFGSAQIQKWNSLSNESKKENDEGLSSKDEIILTIPTSL